MRSATFRHGGQRYRVDVLPYKDGGGEHYEIWKLLGRSGAGFSVSFGHFEGGKIGDYAGDPPRVTKELIAEAQKALDCA